MLNSSFFDFISFSIDINTVLIEKDATVQFGALLTQNEIIHKAWNLILLCAISEKRVLIE